MSTTNDQMIAGYDYKEWVRLESLFLKDYENSTRYNKPFSALISDVLENETYKSFADKTGLSENMLYRLKKQVIWKDQFHQDNFITNNTDRIKIKICISINSLLFHIGNIDCPAL